MNRTKTVKVPLLFIIPLIICTSCISIKPGATKGSRNLYESFFVGQGVNQYFIKPLGFKSSDVEELTIDFTFRLQNPTQDTVRMNISLVSENIIRIPDSLLIQSAGELVRLNQFEHLFIERDSKNAFHSRFTSTESLQNISELFEDENWKIHVYYKENKISLHPGRRTSRNLATLNHNLFVLFSDLLED